ncbi:uncharacterized protein LOC132197247 [Neocloeon triangulifer]|uniref:uncharacterized protein LOC132197247 n=1 Tax=Neocloeon triangulifer TaxID=2078957 RepID=UPI00286EC169|nr:uncharacterized protein LOC132197247 [Neocloeon triangulifer]
MTEQNMRGAEGVQQLEDLTAALLDIRSQQIESCSSNLATQKLLVAKWDCALLDLKKSLEACCSQIINVIIRPKTADAYCQYTESPDFKDEQELYEERITVKTKSHSQKKKLSPIPEVERLESAEVVDGGLPQSSWQKKWSEHQTREASTQVTPPATPSRLRIDLSKVQSSDSSQNNLMDRGRQFTQTQREAPRKACARPSSIPGAINEDPPRRLRNLSKKKVRPESPCGDQSSSLKSTSSEDVGGMVQFHPSTPSKKKGYWRSPMAKGPFWAVTRCTPRAQPRKGEKWIDIAFVRVDRSCPCEVSEYPVGGVLTVATDVFKEGYGSQR